MDSIRHLPLGPAQNKLLQTIALLRKPISFLETCRHQYGKTFTLNILGREKAVVISDAADLKKVFSDNAQQLNTGEVYSTLMGPVVGKGSLFSLDGPVHVQHRKLLLPPFHGHCMHAYNAMMAKSVQDKIAIWKKDDKLILSNELHDITFNIIFNAIFGMNEENARFQQLKKLLRALLRSFSTPYAHFVIIAPMFHRHLGPLTPWANIMKLRRAICRCIFEEIEDRNNNNLEPKADILSALLKSRDEAGIFLTNEDICDEILTVLIAGYDATSMSTCWGFYGILSNPDIYNKLMEELNGIVGQKEDLIVHLDKLVYLDAVVKEALRVNPVIPLMVRVTKENYQLGRYTLPKGTGILPCTYLAHRDPTLWSEPEKFKPERFINSATIPFSYVPFGSGIRRCIGAAFTHNEMKIVIANILLHAELKLKENYEAKIVMRGVAAVPSGGVPVVVTKLY